jgi:hypothetical protein
MADTISTWRGKPLDDYSKDELIAIVIELGQMQQQEAHEHIRQLDVVSDLLKLCDLLNDDLEPPQRPSNAPKGATGEGE